MPNRDFTSNQPIYAFSSNSDLPELFGAMSKLCVAVFDTFNDGVNVDAEKVKRDKIKRKHAKGKLLNFKQINLQLEKQ